MAHCRECGNEISIEAKFCEKCGTLLLANVGLYAHAKDTLSLRWKQSLLALAFVGTIMGVAGLVIGVQEGFTINVVEEISRPGAAIKGYNVSGYLNGTPIVLIILCVICLAITGYIYKERDRNSF